VTDNVFDYRLHDQWTERPVPAVFDHDGLLVSPALLPGITDNATPAPSSGQYDNESSTPLVAILKKKLTIF
jgi:hypothetical protein